jgi:hypothetical protein
MFLKLLLIVLLFACLVFAQENNGDKIIKPELKHFFNDTTLIEIFSDISKEYNTFLDIAPLPIFDELTDLDNENVNQVFESITEFNELVNNDQKILGSVEQSVKSSKDYDTCETDIVSTVCTYFRDKGDYSITVEQEISARMYTYAVYLSGIFEGVDYGRMYLLQDQTTALEEKRFGWNIYRPASPPECANELWYSFDKYVFDDETTIYTPWGKSSNQEIILKSTHYACFPVFGKKDNYPSSCNEMIIDGNTLTLRISNWSFKNEQLYHFWVGVWDFESQSGTWISFDEDGMVKNTGPM